MHSLIAELSAVPDPRARKGRCFSLASLLALAVCAMTPAGHDSLTAAAEWCQRATHQELATFELPYNIFTSRYRVPSEKTLRRVLGLLDPAEVSAAGFAYLRPLLEHAARTPHGPRTPDGLIEREQRRAHRRDTDQDPPEPHRQALAVDGMNRP
ncbi:transposase family protein [Streptomyces sp. NPDC001978]|uniref:transposase family protein n=1 Tax=Streptomyces sp. NPDC001978 TaxID=3364627 RepID=UPI0036C6437F